MPSGNPRISTAAPVAAASREARGPGRRLRGAIARKLGVAIVSGHYPPGATLSGEVAFSEALNVSRSAYREAVQVLTAKRLVESRTKAGTRVLPRHRWHLLDPDVLAWAFAGEPDTQFVRDLFELRAIVEIAAARRLRLLDARAAAAEVGHAGGPHLLAPDRSQRLGGQVEVVGHGRRVPGRLDQRRGQVVVVEQRVPVGCRRQVADAGGFDDRSPVVL